jgi:hypothetical protein
VPFWHVSTPVVQRLLSLHTVPLGAFCVTQPPVAGLQTLTLHGSVLVGQVFGEPDWQVPFWHVSFSVQRFPSWHGVSFGAFWVTQSPVSGSQTLTLHGSVLAGQVFSVPGTQMPFWQLSFSVQALLSALQPVSSGLLRISQVPVWLQTPTLH